MSAQALDDLLKNGWPDDHSKWDDTDGDQPGGGGYAKGQGKEIADRLLGEKIVEAWEKTPAGSRGLLPGVVQTAVEEAKADLQPTVNWRRQLDLWMNRTGKVNRRKTRMRPSKRFGPDALSGSGVIMPPGHNPEGSKSRPQKRLAVILDTSGSVGDEDIAILFRELDGVWQQPGVEVVVYEADTDVQRSYVYEGRLPTSIAGRGGTDFEIPLNRVLEGPEPDGIIYLTDGGAPVPNSYSPGTVNTQIPVLWVITPDGHGEALAGSPNRQSIVIQLDE